MNESEPSTSNQPTQGDFEVYEIPNEHLYEYVDKTTFTSSQRFDQDSSGDGSLRNNPEESMELEEIPTSPQYEYPDQSQSHQYERPSLNNKEADTRGKPNVCAQDSANFPHARPPLNKNESENGSYSSITKEEKPSEKGDATAKKDKEDELFYVDATNGDYTPLGSKTLKENESKNGGYTSLTKEEKPSEKGDATAKKDKEHELFYVDATNGDYTPLGSKTLKENESENGGYTSLTKEEKPSEKGDATAKKDKEDELFYVEATNGDYTPLGSKTLKENESENGGYTSLTKEEKPSEKGDATAKKDKEDELFYVDATNGDYTPLGSKTLKENESENGGYTSLTKEEKPSEKDDTTAKKDKEDELFYVDATNGDYTPLGSKTLKENESENAGYTSLTKEEKPSEKGDATAKKDKEDELFYADATNGDYTPLGSKTLKENESENGSYTS